jgi:hypothetical protein
MDLYLLKRLMVKFLFGVWDKIRNSLIVLEFLSNNYQEV